MTFGLFGTTLTTRIRDLGTIFGTTRPENEVRAGSAGPALTCMFVGGGGRI
jgi:hypothetical protein